MPVLFVHSWDIPDTVCYNIMYVHKFKSLFFIIIDATVYTDTRFGQGTGPIFVDNTGCTGVEPRLLACDYDTHTADCTHAEDAGLRCSGRCTCRYYYCII